MVYDNLLLAYGGGIIGDAHRATQYVDSAVLAIGIGGVGIAALSSLRGKIHSQLIPDNPGEDFPKYESIQLLGIDSDEMDYRKYRGSCRLGENEFYSICNYRLHQALQQKRVIKEDPTLNWMDIDCIQEVFHPSIRQIGRFLLMKKVGDLKTEIMKKCHSALRARRRRKLDVYVFAGVSGGTGSGCFLDVCYIVREIAREMGIEARIYGYFFLPDVVTGKPEVASKKGGVAYNYATGYATLKELDYHMDLRAANDHFVQNYGNGLKVDTQEPPVDMCHLISAVRADGTPAENGFGYAINVASDYAMACLAQVDSNGMDDESGVTMRGHLDGVAQGVLNLRKKHGANKSEAKRS